MKVNEWHDVTAERFTQEILPAGQPALLRGLVRDWPAVQAGRASPAEAADYLRKFSTGANVKLMTGDPSIDGRFFYNADLTGLNFETSAVPFVRVLGQLMQSLQAPAPPALYAGAIPIAANPMRQAARPLHRDDLHHGLRERFAQRQVLVCIEMHAIDAAGTGHTAGIEERASERGRDLALSRGQPDRSGRATGKLRCDRAARLFHGRRSHDQNRRNRHARLDRRLADGIHQGREALCRKPRIVLMHSLKIIRAEHHDH